MMHTIQLDTAAEQRLSQLARTTGKAVEELLQVVIQDYLVELEKREEASARHQQAARLADLTAFFAPLRKDLSHFQFDREDANAR